MIHVEYQCCFEDFKQFSLAHLSPETGEWPHLLRPWLIFILLEVLALGYICFTYLRGASPPTSDDSAVNFLPWIIILIGWGLLFGCAAQQMKRHATKHWVYVVPGWRENYVQLLLCCVSIGIVIIWITILGSIASAKGGKFARADVILPMIPWIIIEVFLWLAMPFMHGRKWLALWRSNPSFGLPSMIEADDSEVTVRNVETKLVHQWAGVRRVIETPRLFCLYISAATAHIIPKRAFASLRSVDEFRSLLRRHVTDARDASRPAA